MRTKIESSQFSFLPSLETFYFYHFIFGSTHTTVTTRMAAGTHVTLAACPHLFTRTPTNACTDVLYLLFFFCRTFFSFYLIISSQNCTLRTCGAACRWLQEPLTRRQRCAEEVRRSRQNNGTRCTRAYVQTDSWSLSLLPHSYPLSLVLSLSLS